MCKRIFSLVLAIALVLAMLPAVAPNVVAAQMPAQKIEIPTTINPVYEDILDERAVIDQLKNRLQHAFFESASTMSAEEYYDEDTATEQLKDALKARTESVVVRWYVPYLLDDQDMSQFVSEAVVGLFADALEHTGDPAEGDYILWQLGGFTQSQCLYFVKENEQRVYIEMPYLPIYYTTAEQEAELNVAVEKLLTDLDLDEADSYTKVKAVYDYICTNVTYDDANLNDDSYLLKYTAYAALVNGTAVCQGYAVLFYRLMLELGIDARVITGWKTSTGGAHAWNIVELRGNYYNLDATWDAGRSEYSYFLRNDENFLDHTRKDVYNTDAFCEAYPIGQTDFDPSADNRCGENAYWSFDEATGTLTISGEGAMDDYSGVNMPWVNWLEQITKVEVTGGITYIGKFAFYHCVNMTEAILHEGIVEIGAQAFYCCSGLTTICLPDSLLTVGDSAFAYCAAAEILYARSIETIGDNAFFHCDSLMSVELSDSVMTIGNGAFDSCVELTAVTFGEGLISIGESAFSNCPKLTDIDLPDSLTTMGMYAFCNDRALTQVNIGSGLAVIDEYAFYNCTNLATVNMPETVTAINAYAFGGCTALTELTFTGDAPIFGEDAFHNAELKIFYPANNPTWTEAVMQQYGGTITWVASGTEEPVYSDGWNQIDGIWYYYQDGEPVTGWLKDGNYWYYMNADGIMTTGWVNIGGKWFYMNQNGVMMTGWQKINGYWYYFASGGAMQTGWVAVGGKWYYFASGGAMQTGWVAVGGKWYYFASGGAMQTGWIQLDGTWYYLTSTGAMATGWTYDGSYWYYMDGNGMMQRGWITVNGKWYYLNKSGVMQTGWLKDGGYWYYLDATGAMVTGTQVIGGKTYVFNKSGVWIG